MKREIILIDEEKCIGCGQCVSGCHEGAIKLIDGKARLIGDLWCDGLGACIGHCPTDALAIVVREAEPYNETTVMEALIEKGLPTITAHLNHLRDHGQTAFYNEGVQYLIDHHIELPQGYALINQREKSCNFNGTNNANPISSALTHWPVQLHLVMAQSPHFKGSHLLLAADCTAFALGAFHNELLAGKTLAIACPKLDDYTGYLEKLIAFIDEAEIASLTVATMEVPCCGGLWALTQEAANKAKRQIPLKRVIVNVDGSLR